MENIILYNELYLCYESLLTEKEKETFLDHFSEDLTLTEIAENNQISKSAVHKTVTTVINKLINYESILHINEKNHLVSQALEEKDISKIKEILNSYNNL